MSELFIKTTKGLKWSVLTLVIPKMISPIITITLAHILLPDAFGLISTAMIVISFSQMIWEAGLSQALIQTTEDVKKVANVVFWSNIGFGLIIYSLIFMSAPALALYFKSPDSLSVIRVLGLQILLLSFTTVQETLFSKELNFRPLFNIRVVTAILSGIISITLALRGFNVWALVAGTLSGSVLSVILLWYLSSWRPSFKVEWSLAPTLFRYGSWVLMLSVMGWFIHWFDSILVGRYFGVFDLGIYRTGATVSMTIFSLVMMPIATVMFPSFSKLANDREKLLKYYHEVNKIIMALVLPAAVGLFLVGRDFAVTIFGWHWEDLGTVVGILALSEGLGHICGMNPLVYQAIGKPDIQPKISIFLMPVFAAMFWFVTPYGMVPLLWTKLILTILITPINVYILVRTLKVSPFYLYHQGKYIFIALVFMAIAVIGVNWTMYYFTIYDPSTLLTIQVLVGMISYLGTLWFLDREFILKIKSVIILALEK